MKQNALSVTHVRRQAGEEDFARECVLPSEPPESVKAELDITYVRIPEQELKHDVYRPKSGEREVRRRAAQGGRKERKLPRG